VTSGIKAIMRAVSLSVQHVFVCTGESERQIAHVCVSLLHPVDRSHSVIQLRFTHFSHSVLLPSYTHHPKHI
jgi:hypothetical protein